ncbi:MAG TPA: hypothetical protein DDW36_00875 [Candidatus Magasanikbacteria bacterium]|nr:hypothetical protein [Candidatus Magasanikbacteria bacterium]
MEQSESKGFFDGLSSKTAFGLGIAAAVLGLGTIGFIVLLVFGFNGKSFSLAAGNAQIAAPTPAGIVPEAAPLANVPSVSDEDHIRGANNAKVTIVEYSDFECPYCQRFHGTMQQILAKYPNDVRWVYRHFPLDQLHPTARPAAEASECVAALGGNDKFWAFADKIFAVAGVPPSADKLEQYAKEIGLNVNSFKSCVSGGKYKQTVADMEAGGAAAGVRGTPGNFLIAPDGTVSEIPGAQPFETIDPVLQQMLAS